MHRIQSHSASWEALYFKHPDFTGGIDLCFYHNNQMVGIFAGHSLKNEQQDHIYSIEIMAIDPDHQNKGFGKQILQLAWQHTPKAKAFIFWTNSPKASQFYSNAGLHLNSSLQLKKTTWQNKTPNLALQHWATSKTEPHNLKEYLMTQTHYDQIQSGLKNKTPQRLA